MNRIVRAPLGIFRFAVFTGALIFVCASGAYAQEGGKKNPDTGNIKMVIPGIPGDNVDGSIDVFAIDQHFYNLRSSKACECGRPGVERFCGI